ncbi:septal ring lytic transglycosylase RlpA family protein [Azoarcus taiwanensis]|nr:septal ring lytic transglycosylase RlpA family protein [Azoarcus taiwanensis]
MTIPTLSSRQHAMPPSAPFSVLACRLAVAGVLVFGLAACGGKPTRVSDASGATTGTAPASAVTTTRGGGYYLDDGPDAVIPVGLDEIPDAVPRIEPFHRPAFRPYTVFGQEYVPRTELTPFRERGHGSWYGRRFHGNPTSTGEPYDMYAMTAAHPTLPLPSYARVTNIANGRSVIVRINDRGPFLRGRIIDLSYAAAHRLGYINAGSAMVEVESITHEDIRVADARGVPALPGTASSGTQIASAPTPAVAPAPTQQPPRQIAAIEQQSLPPLLPRSPIASDADGAALQAAAPLRNMSGPVQSGAYLQLAAFSTPANAETLAARVRTELAAFADRLHLLDEGGRYRLQLGPFASADDARLEAQRIGMMFDLQPFVVMR